MLIFIYFHLPFSGKLTPLLDFCFHLVYFSKVDAKFSHLSVQISMKEYFSMKRLNLSSIIFVAEQIFNLFILILQKIIGPV